MSRDKLDKETAERIEGMLPYVQDLRKKALSLRPEMISMAFPPPSLMTEAAVCLHDVTSTLQEIRYALLEAYAHLIFYREKSDPPNEGLAVFFGRFFIDDAALRLYSAGEHSAKAIVGTLGITSSQLAKYRKKEGSTGSEQRTVGLFMLGEMPEHPVSKSIYQLIHSDNWISAIRYRNDWVHSKPPIIEGMGIEYQRRNRLEISEDFVGISVGGGDEPEYKIDALLEIVTNAAFEFQVLVELLLDTFCEIPPQKGILAK